VIQHPARLVRGLSLFILIISTTKLYIIIAIHINHYKHVFITLYDMLTNKHKIPFRMTSKKWNTLLIYGSLNSDQVYMYTKLLHSSQQRFVFGIINASFVHLNAGIGNVIFVLYKRDLIIYTH